MNVSVILCTYNRCGALTKALESVAVQILPHSVTWEVLVADNNSDDQTRAVVESFCVRYPDRFRYLFEPKQGKSHALNAAIHEARGAILAFMDDDVTVEPTWLQNLTANLYSGEWVGAGGLILPEQTFTPPRWLSLEERYASGPLALFDLGPEARELAEPPFGNNMAFRRKMFQRYGGFRTDLGPQPGSRNPQKCEDSEFGHRLLAAGERLRYEPSAKVYHALPKSRLRKRYFLDWWFDKGRSDLRELGIPPEVRWFFGGIPLCMLRRLAVWTLRCMFAVKPSRRFFCRTQVRWLAGQVVEARRQREISGL
jgi:glucosyl-dolichyl phosphate glucuronosyltransferase